MNDRPLYLQPRQASARPPTAWENDLADVLEATFGGGAHELPAIVAALNASRVRLPSGAQWSEESFVSMMSSLGA